MRGVCASPLWLETGASIFCRLFPTLNTTQASISSDNHLRIYECLEQPSLTTWQLSEEADVQALPLSPSVSPFTRAQQTNALATPTQTSSSLDGASAPLIAQALQQGLQQSSSAQPRSGLGNREADGGWCISWCKDRYWGEIIAAGAGTSGVIKVSLRPLLLRLVLSRSR